MSNAILLHGMPDKEEYYDATMPSMSNAHWLPWLQAQLLKHDIETATPEVPYSFEPKWERWVKEVERYEIGPDTLLIGHSCGAGFWLRYLSERPDLRVGKVILVAPWIDVEQDDPNLFFNFDIDSSLPERTKGLIIFHSDNDGDVMQTSLQKLKAHIPGLNVRVFHEYGHFTSRTLKTGEFPELLEEAVISK